MMPRSRITWPEFILSDLFERAENGQVSEALVGSPREAELLRFALYNHRRRTGQGQGISISLQGSTVSLTRSQISIQIKECAQ